MIENRQNEKREIQLFRFSVIAGGIEDMGVI